MDSLLMTEINYDNLSELLARLQTEVLKEFLHRCIDEICGRKGPNKERFCSHGGWSTSEYFAALKNVKEFFIAAVAHQYDKEKIDGLFTLDPDHLQGLSTCFAVRKHEVQEVLVENISKTPGVSLRDFDWKLKWVMGSSSLASIREPLLQLDLFTEEQELCESPLKSNRTKCVSVELSREDLSSVINCLEVANENLSQ